MSQEPEDRSGQRFANVALVGQPNVGKSSLLNAMVGQPLAIVSAKAQTTRLPVVGLLTEGDRQLAFHDLPGLLEPEYLLQERMLAMAVDTLRTMDLALLLHPANRPGPPDPADIGRLVGKPLATVLVLTKADLIDPDTLDRPAGSFLVSAKTGCGVGELVSSLMDRAPLGAHRYPADDLGTQPVRFFVAEYLREAAFELLEEELPYCIAVEVEEFREDRDPVYIRATLFVERRSQKGMVIGSGGATIRAIGQQARQRLEDLLGRAVYLDTWVKVLPGWRDRSEHLSRFGLTDPNAGGRR